MKRARESDVVVDLTSDNWYSDSDIEVVDVQVIENNEHLESLDEQGPGSRAGVMGKNKQEKVDGSQRLASHVSSGIISATYNSDNSVDSEERLASETGWTSDAVEDEDEPYIDESGSETEHNILEIDKNEHNTDDNTDGSSGESAIDTSEANPSLAESVPSTAQTVSSVAGSVHHIRDASPSMTESMSSASESMPSIAATVPSVAESSISNPPSAASSNAPSKHLFTDPGPHPDFLPKFITLIVVSIVPFKESRKEIRWLPRKPFYRLLDGYSSENVVIVHNNQAVKIYSTPSQVDPSSATMTLLILTKRQFQDTMLLADPTKAFAMALNPEQPESVVDLVSAGEKQFPIKLKGALGLVRVMVTMSTQCEQLMQHYAKEMNISSPVSIKLDGDDVDPKTTVEDMDLEEDDMLDVYS